MHERSALYETRYSTKASCEDYTAKSQARLIFTVINIALARVYEQHAGGAIVQTLVGLCIIIQ